MEQDNSEYEESNYDFEPIIQKEAITTPLEKRKYYLCIFDKEKNIAMTTDNKKEILAILEKE